MSQGGVLNDQSSTPSGPGRFPITPYVVGPIGQAGYQTIQSAINAANGAGGGAVYIQPGIYTENLTLYNAVDLWGAVGVADTGTCKIIGQHTPPLTGAMTIRNIFLQGSANIFFSNASGSSTLILIDCAISIVNGYTFNLPNWTGVFIGFNLGESGSTSDGWVNNTAGAVVFMTNITMGSGTANPMITSGFIELYDCVVNCPCNFSNGTNGIIDGGTLFQHQISFSGNANLSMANSNVQGGTSPAITYNSSGTTTISNCIISSTNNPSITGTGSGILKLSDINFTNNSSISGTFAISVSSANLFGEVRAGADIGGQTGFSSLTNTNSQVIAGGTGTVKMSSSNNANNAAWIKIYVGTTPFWIPAWTSNAP